MWPGWMEIMMEVAMVGGVPGGDGHNGWSSRWRRVVFMVEAAMIGGVHSAGDHSSGQ